MDDLVFFQDLISQYTISEILEELFRLYPDQRKNIEGYSSAIMEFMSIPKANFPLFDIIIVKEGEDFSVCGINPCGIFDSISHSPWNKWAIATVDDEFIEAFSEITFIALCTYELTYAGYSDHDVRHSL